MPAQREAGVIKSARFPALREEDDDRIRLEKLARAGACLLERERGEIWRLSLLWDEHLTPAIKTAAAHMDARELMALRKDLEKKLEGSFPPLCQLPGKNSEVRFDGDDYKI